MLFSRTTCAARALLRMARLTAVSPLRLRRVRSAPCISSSFTQCGWFFIAANISGVQPFSSCNSPQKISKIILKQTSKHEKCSVGEACKTGLWPVLRIRKYFFRIRIRGAVILTSRSRRPNDYGYKSYPDIFGLNVKI